MFQFECFTKLTMSTITKFGLSEKPPTNKKKKKIYFVPFKVRDIFTVSHGATNRPLTPTWPTNSSASWH